jgi:hypothetical protein
MTQDNVWIERMPVPLLTFVVAGAADTPFRDEGEWSC